MNAAKERLAYELTKLVHGEEEAEAALKKAHAAFSGDSENMPTATITADIKSVVDVLVYIKAAPSKGEARRLIQGGGISVDGNKISDINAQLTDSQIANGFVLQKGKKNFWKITL